MQLFGEDVADTQFLLDVLFNVLQLDCVGYFYEMNAVESTQSLLVLIIPLLGVVGSLILEGIYDSVVLFSLVFTANRYDKRRPINFNGDFSIAINLQLRIRLGTCEPRWSHSREANHVDTLEYTPAFALSLAGRSSPRVDVQRTMRRERENRRVLLGRLGYLTARWTIAVQEGIEHYKNDESDKNQCQD